MNELLAIALDAHGGLDRPAISPNITRRKGEWGHLIFSQPSISDSMCVSCVSQRRPDCCHDIRSVLFF
jgi:hypothetical protein